MSNPADLEALFVAAVAALQPEAHTVAVWRHMGEASGEGLGLNHAAVMATGKTLAEAGIVVRYQRAETLPPVRRGHPRTYWRLADDAGTKILARRERKRKGVRRHAPQPA